MNIAWFARGGACEDDDMARAAKKAVVDTQLVKAYAARLAAARTDRSAFGPVFTEIKGDARLKAADLIAVAKAYAGASKKIGSKTAALDAIEKRFVELVRFDAKNALAAKSRPW